MLLTSIQEWLVGEHIQALPTESDSIGNLGSLVAYPETEAQIASILRYGSDRDLTIISQGGGTKRGFGGIEEKAHLLLSLTSYKGIVEYSKGDMTITVKAGTTIKEISDFLGPNDQMLPLDPSWPEFATIGGVVAANDSGPKRCRYGSARDLVIGMRVTYPDGRIIRTGGKVVKNVAGYDMNKLFIGSMGTLGVINEVTLKLRPLPKYSSVMILSFPSSDLSSIRSFCIDLLDSFLEPVSLELLSPSLHERLYGKSGYALLISFEDVEKAVRYQEEWIKSHQSSGTHLHILDTTDAAYLWNQFSQISPNAVLKSEGEEMALKIGSKNLDVIPLLHHCHELGRDYGLKVEAHGGPAHGLTYAYVKGDSSRFPSFVEKIRAIAKDAGGYVVIRHASLPLRQQLNVWGERPASFSLLDGIKRSIDPKQILNPKRFVGGI